MEELERAGNVDLNSCGIAAYSAATIHRMKTERLLKADIPRTSDENRGREVLIVPPPVNLPYMPEFMVATVNELVQALRAVFLKPQQKKDVEEEKALLEVFDVKLDEFLVKIEERLEEFIEGLERIFEEKEIVDVADIFSGVDKLEAARRFILLLFAAARGVVELIEDDECRLIAVKWNGGGLGGTEGQS
ncbi:MAG: hypothetical protein J7J94_02550 [Thaumarchaeota archaeon]|nr:hypothetical protein [Nitrososphaerota archaeon]